NIGQGQLEGACTRYFDGGDSLVRYECTELFKSDNDAEYRCPEYQNDENMKFTFVPDTTCPELGYRYKCSGFEKEDWTGYAAEPECEYTTPPTSVPDYGDCATGTQGCECYGNATCDDGLTCTNGVCQSGDSGGVCENLEGDETATLTVVRINPECEDETYWVRFGGYAETQPLTEALSFTPTQAECLTLPRGPAVDRIEIPAYKQNPLSVTGYVCASSGTSADIVTPFDEGCHMVYVDGNDLSFGGREVGRYECFGQGL
ncbi:MAG: hypothetical protein ACQEVA_23180, partial [Myxococcota bacterium]